MVGKLTGALLLALVAAMAIPIAAGALIRPGVGIGGVRLRMTESQVRASAGKPLRIRRDEEASTKELFYRDHLSVFLDAGRVGSAAAS